MSRDSDNNGISFTSPFLPPINNDSKEQPTTALIVLNSPIARPPSRLFEKLWDLSSVRICADGGANRLYEATADNRKRWIPNRIRGDLDSLDPEVRAFYESSNINGENSGHCLIEKIPCQNSNDLTKALQVCNTDIYQRIFIYGAFGGRFDQEMASFQSLYAWGPKFNYQIWLYSDETCAVLIPPNITAQIKLPCFDNHVPDDDLGEGPTCGLIPLGCICDSLITTGLKWNLDGVPSEFGGLVSTSNRIMEPIVTIRASHPIVFTAEIIMEENEPK